MISDGEEDSGVGVSLMSHHRTVGQSSARHNENNTLKEKMATPSKENGAFEVAPLRSLDDFLLESARFQVPNFRDMEKWGKRVYSNLIYYQSNYFLLALALFALVG